MGSHVRVVDRLTARKGDHSVAVNANSPGPLPMPAALMPRDQVVMRLLPVFQKHGYDCASLAELSQATGLGKSSLYHYFPGGKADMARAVIERVEQWLEAHAIAPLAGPGAPERRLDRMLKALDGFYAGGRNACVLGTMAIGGARQMFQAQLSAAFARWIDALAALAVETGIPRAAARLKAQDVVIRIEGALILSFGLDDLAPFQRTLRRIPDDLLRPD
jgi:TetR/AcrR family transcriptional regulator, lmrAB and yxaGH operons repressor